MDRCMSERIYIIMICWCVEGFVAGDLKDKLNECINDGAEG